MHSRDAEHASVEIEYIHSFPEAERQDKWMQWLRTNMMKMRRRAEGNSGFTNQRVAEYAQYALCSQYASKVYSAKL